MISYVEEQGTIASVVHDDGTRTQFVLGNYETNAISLLQLAKAEVCID